MRRPRTAALALAGGLLFGAPVLTACSEEEPAVEQEVGTDEAVEDDIEDLDDEGAVEGVDEQDG